MNPDADFNDFLHARWPMLVAALEAERVDPDEARLAVAEILLARRRGWDRLVVQENVDVLVWQALRERTGLIPQPGEAVPVMRANDPGSAPLSGDGPEPWLARAVQARQAHRRVTLRRSVLAILGLAVTVAGIAWWATRPLPPPVREETNRLPVVWYAGDELHLAGVVVELRGVETFVAFRDGAAVRRTSGATVQVDGDGDVSDLSDPPFDLSFAPDLPDYLPFESRTFVVQGAPSVDGGWVYVLDSRRGASDAVRHSDPDQQVLVLCDADRVCRGAPGGMPADDFRLR